MLPSPPAAAFVSKGFSVKHMTLFVKMVPSSSWMFFFLFVMIMTFGGGPSCCCTMVYAMAVGNHNNSPPLPRNRVTSEDLDLAKRAMSFFDASTDPHHAVKTSAQLLQTAGFVRIPERTSSSLSLEPGGKYYFTKHDTSLVAFRVGKHCAAATPMHDVGFHAIAGHADSPNLRVKPRSKRSNNTPANSGRCIQIGVECYGGGLWHTWFDRDLGISGRVAIRQSTSSAQNDDDNNEEMIRYTSVRIDRPILRIPNLAIHLQTENERKAFSINKEDHLSPILAQHAQKVLTTTATTNANKDLNSGDENDNNKETTTLSTSATDNGNKIDEDGWVEYQEPVLLDILASELGVHVKDILDFDLSLFDVQRAALGGAYTEFIHSARLDNLASCFLAVQALIDHAASAEENDDKNNDSDVAMVVLYDHEEVGSTSSVGAASPILSESIRRIVSALLAVETSQQSTNNPQSHPHFEQILESCLRRSFVISSDQAHAVHPNYASKHESMHRPRMNEGMVIKRNANQRYATAAATGLLLRQVARREKLQLQEFIVRQDCGCGSTVGPIISAATGIRTIDVGCPQLSMHSIRETMGVRDLAHGLQLFRAFYKHFRKVDQSIR